jgi:hypothetical protein
MARFRAISNARYFHSLCKDQYRLTFKAMSVEHCYWWLDYFDKDGQTVPDCNSKVYPGNDSRDYDEVVYVPGATRSVQIAFVSKGKVEASDIRFTTATAAEAAQWCDGLYNKLPPLKFTAPPDSMALLPKTAAAMKNGAPWKAIMLGNSTHSNDVGKQIICRVLHQYFLTAK